MKRHLLVALSVVAALVAGALTYLGHHLDFVSRRVDIWLREAWHKLENEPIDPEWAVVQVAQAAVPIAVFVAGCLVLLMIVVVLHGLRKVQADHLPGSRRKRRTKKVAQGPKGTA